VCILRLGPFLSCCVCWCVCVGGPIRLGSRLSPVSDARRPRGLRTLLLDLTVGPAAVCDCVQERIIIEEHAVWQKNIPHFYDTQVSHALEWTSLTVQWMPPSYASSASGPSSASHLLLGTHAFEHQPNFLLVAQVHLPVGEDSSAADAMDVAADSSVGATLLAKARRHAPTAISVRQKIYLDSEVNRARAMVRGGQV
jgi:hypothetical protein